MGSMKMNWDAICGMDIIEAIDIAQGYINNSDSLLKTIEYGKKLDTVRMDNSEHTKENINNTEEQDNSLYDGFDENFVSFDSRLYSDRNELESADAELGDAELDDADLGNDEIDLDNDEYDLSDDELDLDNNEYDLSGDELDLDELELCDDELYADNNDIDVGGCELDSESNLGNESDFDENELDLGDESDFDEDELDLGDESDFDEDELDLGDRCSEYAGENNDYDSADLESDVYEHNGSIDSNSKEKDTYGSETFSKISVTDSNLHLTDKNISEQRKVIEQTINKETYKQEENDELELLRKQLEKEKLENELLHRRIEQERMRAELEKMRADKKSAEIVMENSSEHNRNNTSDIQLHGRQRATNTEYKAVRNDNNNCKTYDKQNIKLENTEKQVVKKKYCHDDYSNMKDALLWRYMRSYLHIKGVEKKPVSKEGVIAEFGLDNVKRMMNGGYIILTGKGFTCG